MMIHAAAPARATSAIAITLVGLAVACTSDDAPPEGPAPVAETSAPAAPSAPAPTPPEAAAAPAVANKPYVYSFAGGRDPFRSYLADLHEREAQERQARTHEETENFDLTQYRLTAVLLGHGQPTAMVEDPTGAGHIVKLGSRIGKNDGRVMHIDAGGLTISETFYDGNGQPMQVSAALGLPADPTTSLSSSPSPSP